MALKFITKTDDQTKLPEGGDRFVWDKLPTVIREQAPPKPVNYAKVLKFVKKALA